MSNRASYRVLRGETNYLKLVLANLVNRFGDSIDSIAFSWMMYQVTGSAAMMALIVGLNYIPTIVLQPFAGALADRLPKKRVMIGMDVGRGVLVLLTALLLRSNLLTPALLIAVTMSNSILEALRDPAGGAIVPKLISPEKYTVATAFNSTLSHVTELVGLALAGGMIAWIGVAGALLVDMATFALSAGILSLLRVKEELPTEKANFSNVWQGLRSGVRYAASNHVLLALALLGMLMNFCVVPINVFGTPYVVDDLHAGPELLSLIQIAMVAGMGVGAFVCPKLRMRGKTQIVASGCMVSLAILALALIPRLGTSTARAAAAMATMLCIGLGVGVLNVVFNAAFTRLVPQEILGTLNGCLGAILCASMPIGSFLCSTVSSFASVTDTLMISGVVSMALYIAMLWVKPLNEV